MNSLPLTIGRPMHARIRRIASLDLLILHRVVLDLPEYFVVKMDLLV